MLSILQEDRFEELYQMFEDSFPSDEYRPYQTQRALLSNPHYQIYVYEKNHEIAAFFATWEGPHFIFLEHFAVKESFRNGGLGSKLLQEFLKLHAKPIVIEIEPPEGEIEKRRARFYERNGFHLSQWGYVQPALAKGQNPVSLVLMSYPKPLQEQEYQSFKNWVFNDIYT
ncbi:GNAT family N-acetyltransferase [Bacillus sinesaloumensis]|uniref:GNAT family N-acetyltransferase n=1 Tax=Litchfieldia sinesaloumensis TaxID=1926280 RepID=UPI0009886690|nr:GNAT family N-acetyltransferase [Bacillus sinesaloumensis]